MPRWLLRMGLVLAVLDAVALLVGAAVTGEPSLLSHVAPLLLVVAVVLALDRGTSPARRSPRLRPLPRAFVTTALASAACAVALLHDWRLDAAWTPPLLFFVSWLAVLAIASGWRLVRERLDGA